MPAGRSAYDRVPFTLGEVTDVDARTGPELIDELHELQGIYVDWLEECIGLRRAYGLWLRVPAEDRGLAFASYRAALDREEQASVAYANQIERIRNHALQ